MKGTPLKTIADIQTGYTFRSALKEDENGNAFVMQARNVSGRDIDPRDLDRIMFLGPRTSTIIQKEDVVVSARGYFRAMAIRREMGNTIASSSVYIVRLKDTAILPEYLAIYLNSWNCQKLIEEKATGGAINTILKKDLENIPVPVLNIKTQKTIIALKNDVSKLQRLVFEKGLKIDLVFNGALEQLLTTK